VITQAFTYFYDLAGFRNVNQKSIVDKNTSRSSWIIFPKPIYSSFGDFDFPCLE
jgi:hypothetical protein